MNLIRFSERIFILKEGLSIIYQRNVRCMLRRFFVSNQNSPLYTKNIYSIKSQSYAVDRETLLSQILKKQCESPTEEGIWFRSFLLSSRDLSRFQNFIGFPTPLLISANNNIRWNSRFHLYRVQDNEVTCINRIYPSTLYIGNGIIKWKIFKDLRDVYSV